MTSDPPLPIEQPKANPVTNPLTERARALLAAECCVSVEEMKYETASYHVVTAGVAIRAIEAALRLPAGVDGWQAIETAPKDGSYILLTDANCVHTCLIARWHKQTKAWWGQGARSGHSIVWNEATHWQPLPAAPRQGPDGGEVQNG